MPKEDQGPLRNSGVGQRLLDELERHGITEMVARRLLSDKRTISMMARVVHKELDQTSAKGSTH